MFKVFNCKEPERPLKSKVHPEGPFSSFSLSRCGKMGVLVYWSRRVIFGTGRNGWGQPKTLFVQKVIIFLKAIGVSNMSKSYILCI